MSLAPVAVRLSELLGQEVKFAADPEVVGPNAKAAVEAVRMARLSFWRIPVTAQKKPKTEKNSPKNWLLCVTYL